MNIEIVKKPITVKKLSEIAENQFGDLVKAVVDIEQEIMAIGGELHADGEALLLQEGSRQENLWGINFYPGKTGEEFMEFDSMINIRPSQGNRSRSVENAELRDKIKAVAGKLVK